MAFAFVQYNQNNSASAASLAVTNAAHATSAGNLLVVTVSQDPNGPAVQTVTVADTANGSYTLAVGPTGPSNSTNQSIFYFPNCAASTIGANTITATFGGTALNVEIRMTEYSGAATSSPVDVSVGASGTGGSTQPSGNVTTTVAGDLIIGANCCHGTTTGVGSGWTLAGNTPGTDFDEYQLNVAIGTYQATFAGSAPSFWASQIVAFKPQTAALVNATVAIAAKTVSGVRANAQVIHDGTFSGSAVALGTFGTLPAVPGHAIIQGKGLTSSFTALYVRNQTGQVTASATLALTPKVTHSATVNISAVVSDPFLSPLSSPTLISASVNLFGFAANNIAIAPINGFASLRALALPQISVLGLHGTAALTLSPKVIHNSTIVFRGVSSASNSQGLVTGSGPLFSTAVINARAVVRIPSSFLTHSASIVIHAGNFAGVIPVEPTLQIRGRAVLSGAVFRTISATCAIKCLARVSPSALVTGVVTFSVQSFIRPFASLSPVPLVTHKATVSMAARASVTATSLSAALTFTHAAVTFLGRASLTFTARVNHFATVAFAGSTPANFIGTSLVQTIVNSKVILNGKASATYTAFLIHNATESIPGRASTFFAATETGVNNAVARIAGSASFLPTAFVVHRATAALVGNTPSIFIGTALLLTILNNNKVTILARATSTLSPLLTHKSTLSVSGRATLTATSFSTVVTVNNAAVRFLGRAALTLTSRINRLSTLSVSATAAPSVFLGSIQGPNLLNSAVNISALAAFRGNIQPTKVFGTERILGLASATLSASRLLALPSTVHILALATPRFAPISLGTTFLNAVSNLAARASGTPSAFKLVNPTIGISGLGNPILFPGRIIRSTVPISGFASFTSSTQRRILTWVSGNTLQYKVWQYNVESMVRVLGSSWTVSSVGLSFQAVAMEVISTDAGWGS